MRHDFAMRVPSALRAAMAGARLQLQMVLASPLEFVLVVLLAPAFYTAMFVLVLRATGKLEALAPFALVGPAIMGMWSAALNIAGEIIDYERVDGTLELAVVAPGHGMRWAVLGRIAASAATSLLSLPVAMLVAGLLGISVAVAQPVQFAAAAMLTGASVAAASLITASTFVLARSARLFQNLLSYPFYLLGGLVFPVVVLPIWMQPLSSVVSLSWGAQAMRQSMSPGTPDWVSYAMLAALTSAYTAIGARLLAVVERRIRYSSSVTAG